MSEMTWKQKLKLMIRENDVEYFEDYELDFYYEKNNHDLNATAYECLIIKAENSGLNVSGMSSADTSQYFLRLAAQFRPNNSGILKGS